MRLVEATRRRAPVISLTYISTASTSFSDGDLATLLMNSRANNRRLGLTGYLMHKQGRFIQVLEGPEDTVQQRYALIAADPRHTDTSVLARETITERRFGSWTMGYHATTDTLPTEIPGYSAITEAPLSETRAQNNLDAPVRALLNWFSASPSTHA